MDINKATAILREAFATVYPATESDEDFLSHFDHDFPGEWEGKVGEAMAVAQARP